MTRSPHAAGSELWVCHLPTVPYRQALAAQERLRDAVAAGELPDTLLLLEHPPVYTRGRRAGPEELPLGEQFYRSRGIELIACDRGGRVTYHGPGQLVGYPIMRVEHVQRHLRTIEAAIIAALAEEGVQARSRHTEGIDYTGVWVAERKIASIGVHIRGEVATHGFAVNIENDLEPFSWIIPCGLPEVAMTSLAHELAPARAPGMRCTRKRIAFHFCRAHGRRQRLVSAARLGINTALPSRVALERPHLMSGSSPQRETVPG